MSEVPRGQTSIASTAINPRSGNKQQANSSGQWRSVITTRGNGSCGTFWQGVLDRGGRKGKRRVEESQIATHLATTYCHRRHTADGRSTLKTNAAGSIQCTGVQRPKGAQSYHVRYTQETAFQSAARQRVPPPPARRRHGWANRFTGTQEGCVPSGLLGFVE